MNRFVLAEDRFRDQVLGCWLGKNIGGTLGAPFEGQKRARSLSFYEPVPHEPLPNDDLDLQLVWLRMLEDLQGRRPHPSDFARYWLRYLYQYPPDEYGFSLRNLDRGLRPPISGIFENRDIDCMGAPIRSEVWACLAPADPQRAAALASVDAMLDHAGGEGVWGEMFWAAIESAAFVIDDPETLINIGLNMIPLSSDVGRAVREVLWCWRNGKDWATAREHIVTLFTNPSFGKPYAAIPGTAHPMLAAPNHGFTVIGWLYGEDFGDKLCKAVNCGFDTDCTGATLGALLGIIHGANQLPKRWCDPVGRGIILHKFTSPCDEPKDIDELTDRTIALANQWVERGHTRTHFGADHSIDSDVVNTLIQSDEARAAWSAYEIDTAVEQVDGLEIIFQYFGEPVLYPDLAKSVGVMVRQDGQMVDTSDIKLIAPSGWEVESLGVGRFTLRARSVEARNLLKVEVKYGARHYGAVFMMLGPAEAKGVSMMWFVETDGFRGPRLRHDPLPENLADASELMKS